MAHKYIINNGDLIIGNTEFHSELLGKRDKSLTIGGGRVNFDHENHKAYFYGNSFDFGSVTLEQFKEAWKKSFHPSIDKYEIFFSKYEYFSDAVNNSIKIQ